MTNATYILNAFSFNMIDITALGGTVNVAASELTLEEAQELAQGAESAVGHPDTANVFSFVLGLDVAANRVSVSLGMGDVVLVGQYRGPRLQEGATELPEGATIQWLRVEVQ